MRKNKDKIRKRIAKNLRLLRKCQGKTVKEFAKELGVSYSHLHNLEHGCIRGMYIDELFIISKKISLDKLFNEDFILKM